VHHQSASYLIAFVCDHNDDSDADNYNGDYDNDA